MSELYWERRVGSGKCCWRGVAAGFLIVGQIAFGQSLRTVTLAWDRNAEPDIIAYRIYVGPQSRTYTRNIDVGNVTAASLPGLDPNQTYYSALTAINSVGLESDFSNEVLIPPADATNTVPLIYPPHDQVVALNSPGALAPFEISDSESPAETLAVTATSSNPILVPVQGLALGGTGTFRSVQIIPLPGLPGSSIITLRVTDPGGMFSETNFRFTVAPPNARPTLDFIPDQVFDQDSGWHSIPLTGITSGSPQENQPLTITVTFSNPNLISEYGVIYRSPETQGTLNLNLAPGRTGSCGILVTVDDGQLINNFTAQYFVVSALLPDEPPFFETTIAAQELLEDGSIGPIPFSVRDKETAVERLIIRAESDNPALIGSSNISISNDASGQMLWLTLKPDQFGFARIILRAIDERQNSAAIRFPVIVRPVNDAPRIALATNQVRVQAGYLVEVPVYVYDPDTPSSNLFFTITSSAINVVRPDLAFVSGNGTNRLLVLATELLGGFSLVKISVSDGLLSTNSSLLVGATNGLEKSIEILEAPRQFSSIENAADKPALSCSITDLGHIAVTWDSVPGARYRVECSPLSQDEQWADCSEDIIAQGPVASWFDPNPAATARFYRIRMLD